MALSLTVNVENKFSWSYIDSQGTARTTDFGSYSANTGINLNITGRLFRANQIIQSGTTAYRLDLFNLTGSQFSGTNTTNFSGGRIHGIFFRNSTGTNGTLYLSTTGTGRCTSFLGSVTGVPIPPLCALPFVNHQGWAIGTGRYVDIKGSPGETFEVVVAGGV